MAMNHRKVEEGSRVVWESGNIVHGRRPDTTPVPPESGTYRRTPRSSLVGIDSHGQSLEQQVYGEFVVLATTH